MTLPNVNDFYDYLIEQDDMNTDEMDEIDYNDNGVLQDHLNNYVDKHLSYAETKEIAIDYGIFEGLELIKEYYDSFDEFMVYEDEWENKINNRIMYMKISYHIFDEIGATDYQSAYNYIRSNEIEHESNDDTDEEKYELYMKELLL